VGGGGVGQEVRVGWGKCGVVFEGDEGVELRRMKPYQSGLVSKSVAILSYDYNQLDPGCPL